MKPRTRVNRGIKRGDGLPLSQHHPPLCSNMSDAYLAAVATRRTNYAITAKSSVSDEKLEAIVKQAVLHSPTSFNTQSSRAVLVLGAENTKLWNLVSESFLKGVPGGFSVG